jgi:hypothetical protein
VSIYSSGLVFVPGFHCFPGAGDRADLRSASCCDVRRWFMSQEVSSGVLLPFTPGCCACRHTRTDAFRLPLMFTSVSSASSSRIYSGFGCGWVHRPVMGVSIWSRSKSTPFVLPALALERVWYVILSPSSAACCGSLGFCLSPLLNRCHPVCSPFSGPLTRPNWLSTTFTP